MMKFQISQPASGRDHLEPKSSSNPFSFYWVNLPCLSSKTTNRVLLKSTPKIPGLKKKKKSKVPHQKRIPFPLILFAYLYADLM